MENFYLQIYLLECYKNTFKLKWRNFTYKNTFLECYIKNVQVKMTKFVCLFREKQTSIKIIYLTTKATLSLSFAIFKHFFNGFEIIKRCCTLLCPWRSATPQTNKYFASQFFMFFLLLFRTPHQMSLIENDAKISMIEWVVGNMF